MNEDMVEAGFDWISEQSQVHNRGTQYKPASFRSLV